MNTTYQGITCAVLGCGTAAVAIVEELFCASPELLWPRRMFFVDNDTVERKNAISCPPFRRYVDWNKADALEDWTLSRRGGVLDTRAICGDVEAVPWCEIVDQCESDDLLVAISALDDFQSRLCALQDLRKLRDGTPCDVINIQVGLDRDKGVVSTFSNRWGDVCPGCYLGALPRKEPCVVMTEDGNPLRGSLQREARACAKRVLGIVEGCMTTGTDRWVGQKTNLTAVFPGADRFVGEPRRRSAAQGCLGAHSPPAVIYWDEFDSFLAKESSNGVNAANNAAN